ncbi:MAG: THUMP domain-containing protein [Conexivisphaerales archaeon]
MKSDLKKIERAVSLVPMCNWCAGRLIVDNVRLAESVGESLNLRTVTTGCAICSDTYTKRDDLVRKAVEKMQEFEFDMFQVGVTLPKPCVEREDELRAKLKLYKGIIIKRALTALFKDEIQRRVNKPVNNDNWDILVLIDVNNKSIRVQPRPISLLVRYVKLERGFYTKAPSVAKCDFGGESKAESSTKINSVECVVREVFSKAFEANIIKLCWSGTEDIDARVFGNGRPIYVQVLDPKRRYMGFLKLGRRQGETVQFPLIEISDTKFQQFEGLKKVIFYTILHQNPLVREKVKLLHLIRNISIPDDHKRKKKMLYWTDPILVNEKELKLLCLMDNGVNPWKVLRPDKDSGEFKGILDFLQLDSKVSVTYDIMNFYMESQGLNLQNVYYGASKVMYE